MIRPSLAVIFEMIEFINSFKNLESESSAKFVKSIDVSLIFCEVLHLR